ncbi:hypothetical protein F7Q99_32365 [Streptomyces kaniharaensis]|uniref:Uncharacterized protein n=1 Tax=Streptomyces kaniharaensis TaxID=212423 RepID=A0A6N7L215_9ACTN|nr:hypothetical protein [Streptomyces kaniharaensis]MQS16757.1 hypothetical protein [Streptomyces kaniharaensis]
MARQRSPKSPAGRPYRPRVGEIVKDRATGRLGAYMGEVRGEYYLRRPEGGIEWSARPADVECLPGEHPTVAIVSVPSEPRTSGRYRAGGPTG